MFAEMYITIICEDYGNMALATELPGSHNKLEHFNYKGEWANV